MSDAQLILVATLPTASVQIFQLRGIYALLSVKFSGLKMCECKKMTNIRYGRTDGGDRIGLG